MTPTPAVPDLAVLICTYNRAAELGDVLRSILQQRSSGHRSYEVVVVDNNSTDDTREVVEAHAAPGGPTLRYVFEATPGKAYALNRGLAEIGAAIVAVLDDDQVLPDSYLEDLMQAFQEYPDASFIGGRVLPVWQAPPPPWLTTEHWGPLGMCDYGDQPFLVGEERPVCLLTFAFRRLDVVAVGAFRTELAPGGTSLGGTEDADLLDRLWSAGYAGYYLPHLVIRHKAPAHRLTRSYHRRWHRSHGRNSALRREARAERSVTRLFDVPAHMYRQAGLDLCTLVLETLRGRREHAFRSELRLHFFRGFFNQRRSERRGALRPPVLRELATFGAALLKGYRE